jgi:serine/alanine adding enzyme
MRRQKTVVLRLSVDEERTWRSMRDKSRNMVRKAQRAGLSVTAEPDALSEFHALYADALLRRGVPAHRLSFLRAAVAGLGEKAELLTAQQSGRMVAGMLLVYGQDSAAYPIQAVTDDFRNSGAVQLLNWEAMRRCIRRGLAVLDMGESREGGSVYASKVNFGGQPSEVFYYDWPPPTTGGVERGPPTARARLDDYLMRKSPLWIRRRYAQRKLELGRLV